MKYLQIDRLLEGLREIQLGDVPPDDGFELGGGWGCGVEDEFVELFGKREVKGVE